MKRKYFGTDGVRGEYGASILTDEFAFRLGKAAGHWIMDSIDRPVIVIGRDTRASGPALRDALARGLRSSGECRILDLGILPTPAVAVYTRNIKASLGVMITASHNPAKDNGIKFFTSVGLKLHDEDELEIEKYLDQIKDVDVSGPVEIEETVDSSAGYLDMLQPVMNPFTLKGLKLVVDTSHGAAYQTTPAFLKHIGAEMVVVGNTPNGDNINDGVGSQFPEHLSEKVLEHQADVGIAHDGDGDRVLFCDERGKIVDGDVLLCMLALHAMRHGQLVENTLVATQQSNLGLDRAIAEAGGRLVRTSVGDRYVLEEMQRSGFNLGGEHSGHIIMSDINPTGDGLLAALKLLTILVQEQKPLSELQSCMTPFPQRTGAVAVKEKLPLEDIPGIQSELKSLKAEMGETGRVLLRYSGTEPKIRLLIEGESLEKVDKWYETLESRIKQYLI